MVVVVHRRHSWAGLSVASPLEAPMQASFFHLFYSYVDLAPVPSGCDSALNEESLALITCLWSFWETWRATPALQESL